MKQKGKIQVGDIALDAEVDLTDLPLLSEWLLNPVLISMMPRFIVGITDDKIVEGSLVEPITDENRLIE